MVMTQELDPRRAAYARLLISGKGGNQRETVLALLMTGGPLTRQEIAQLGGLTINAVCGRVAELIKRGEIEEGEKRECRVTGNTVGTLQVRHKPKAAENIARQEDERREAHARFIYDRIRVLRRAEDRRAYVTRALRNFGEGYANDIRERIARIWQQRKTHNNRSTQ